MALKKSLVEVTHDEGYGDSLLMHINLAFGGKDMRADKVVNPVASAVQVEGIPDGWELVRVDKAERGEFYVDCERNPCEWTTRSGSVGANYVIIRKIEKPKLFRPFANAAEFEPHKRKWVTRVDSSGRLLSGKCRVIGFDDDGFWLGGPYFSYKDAFNRGHSFDDGTPFGVEVTE